MRKIASLENLFKKKYFVTLRAYRHAAISAVNVEISDAAGEKIMNLQQQIKNLESEYKDLFKENGVLRATSLEGLDITNVR